MSCSINFIITENNDEYGIDVYLNLDGTNKERKYNSLSKSKSEIENFISLLKRNDVAFIHIDDMIDDYFFSY